MAKRGDDDHEDVETKEEREARVDEMLDRAKRAQRPTAKKKAVTKSARRKRKK